MRWTPAYVGLGNNLDEPLQQVELAFDELGRLPDTRLVLRSPLYGSAPMGPVPQPDFVNAVAGLLTRLDARELFRELKVAEKRLGREQPVVRWGPRRIDLDLLAYGAARIDEPELTVPHRGLAERGFVLLPLADIAPDMYVPGVGRVRDLAAAADVSGLVRLSE